MGPIRYKAKLLPDGHIAVPPELQAHPGEEFEVQIAKTLELPTEDEVRRQIQFLRDHWMGVAKGTGESIAQDHDEYLYGDRS